MNPLLSRLLGESDVVPVLANMPRSVFRKRGKKPVKAGEPEDESVSRMVREALDAPPEREEEIIPDDAEPVDTMEIMVGKPLRQPKEIVQEPSHPLGDKEKYQTPYAALTAPDVTPQATAPIDPSQVPGVAGPERFTAADLERAPEAKSSDHSENSEHPDYTRAMDVLLGRNRAGKPAQDTDEFQQVGDIATVEAQAEARAQVIVESCSVQEQAKAMAAAAITAAKDGGGSMPDPTPPGDAKAVCNAFRRFAG